jgi:hypothetical protein
MQLPFCVWLFKAFGMHRDAPPFQTSRHSRPGIRGKFVGRSSANILGQRLALDEMTLGSYAHFASILESAVHIRPAIREDPPLPFLDLPRGFYASPTPFLPSVVAQWAHVVHLPAVLKSLCQRKA